MSTIPKRKDITIIRGDDFNLLFSNFSITITNCTFYGDIRDKVTNEVIDSFTVTPSATTINLGLTDTETTALVSGTFKWRFRYKDAGGLYHRLLFGDCFVEDE